jgi:hypothetical protein
MLNIIQNTIGAIRRVGESVVRAGLKMWLPFTKAEPLGGNLVVNGDFSTNSDWDLTNVSGGSASINTNDNTLVFTNGLGYVKSDTSFLINDKSYVAKINIESITSGSIRIVASADASTYSPNYTISGTYFHYFTPTSTNGKLEIYTDSSSTSAVINSISVQEYAQETPDISGNDNNAILKTGKALVFAGNDSVETSFPSSKTIKAIAFWIYPTHSASFETLFNLGITNIPVSNLGDRVIELNHLTIRNRQHYPLNFDVYIDGVYRGETNWNGNNPTLDINQWQRVVLVNSNGTSTVNDTFDIAYTGSGSHGRFKMSDLQIYGADWTTDDIAYDYANPQKLVTDNASSNVTLNDLHAWWHMSEGDGTIAFDSAPLLGVDVVPNGDFSTDNISAISGAGTRSVENNKLKIQEDGLGYSQCIYYNLLDTTKIYKVTFDLTIGTGTYIIYDTIDGDVGLTDGSGSYTAYLTNTSKLYIGSNGAGDVWYLDNITAKEVFNIDGEIYDGSSLGATYDDAQERIPQLGMMNWSKGSNLITYSEDFTQYYKGTNTTITPNFSTSPDGTNTATRLQTTASSNTYLSLAASTNIGESYTLSLWVKNNGGDSLDIGSGTSSNTGVEVGQLIINPTNEWVRYSSVFTATANTNFFFLDNVNNSQAIDCLIWGFQLEESSSATAYRKTNGTAVTDATLISCATDSQKDILGNAVRVKGSGFNLDGTGYAEITEEVFDVGTGAFTISAWAKYKFVYQNSSHNAIFVTGTGLGFNSVASLSSTYPDTTDRGFLFRIGQETIGTNHSLSLVEGNWYHVVGVKKADGDMNLYINGNLQDDTEANSDSLRNDQNKYIGEDANATYDRFYHERIDDVKFYNRELSSDEIEQNYNATKSGHNN